MRHVIRELLHGATRQRTFLTTVMMSSVLWVTAHWIPVRESGSESFRVRTAPLFQVHGSLISRQLAKARICEKAGISPSDTIGSALAELLAYVYENFTRRDGEVWVTLADRFLDDLPSSIEELHQRYRFLLELLIEHNAVSVICALLYGRPTHVFHSHSHMRFLHSQPQTFCGLRAWLVGITAVIPRRGGTLQWI